MHASAMKKCAAGAMLFGGTLGVTAGAQAGVVTWRTDTNATTNYIGSWSPYDMAYNFKAAALTSFSNHVTGRGTLSVTATTASGYSGSLAQSGTSVAVIFQCDRAFVVSGGPVTVTLTAASVGSAQIWTGTGSPSSETRLAMAIGSSVTYTLNDGSYTFKGRGSIAAGTSFDGEVFSVSIPAPGALALLGVAGVVGSRRRR